MEQFELSCSKAECAAVYELFTKLVTRNYFPKVTVIVELSIVNLSIVKLSIVKLSIVSSCCQGTASKNVLPEYIFPIFLESYFWRFLNLWTNYITRDLAAHFTL